MATNKNISMQNIRRLTKQVESAIFQHFGVAGKPTFGTEIEFFCRMKGDNQADMPITPELLNEVFGDVILKTSEREAELEGSQITISGDYTRQFEIKTAYMAPASAQNTARVRTPREQARILEVLQQIISNRASEYGLEAVVRTTRPMNERRNLSNSIHFNTSILLNDGRNGFEDDNQMANKLMLSFIESSFKFAREGGALLYSPSQEAFSRWFKLEDGQTHAIDGPVKIGLGSRREDFNFPGGLIRGRKYNAERVGQPFLEGREGGDLRYEDRLGNAQCIGELDTNHQFIDAETPYRFVEAHLLMLQEGFKIYNARKELGTLDELTEKYLQDYNHPLPQSLDEALEQFRNSDYMKELWGEKRRDAIADNIERMRDGKSISVVAR